MTLLILAAALVLLTAAHANARVPQRTAEDVIISNLLAIARCETGGKRGQNGRPDWDHRARSEHAGHWYEGSLGFLDTTWDQFKPKSYPAGAHQATRAQQLVVARRLVRRFGGYSSWPACSRRLGLR